MDSGRACVGVHLECAIRALTLETWEDTAHGLVSVEHHTIADELRRMDAALGRRGSTMLAALADTIDEVYTELLAARAMLRMDDDDDE